MYILAIILNCLFYIPVMNDDHKCIELEKILGITASVLRLFLDLLKIIYIIRKLRANISIEKWKQMFVAIFPHSQVRQISTLSFLQIKFEPRSDVEVRVKFMCPHLSIFI